MLDTITLPEKIKKIAIIDDNAETREGMGEFVVDAEMEPVFEPPEGDSIDNYIKRIMKRADAAIFDHHLKAGNYAAFDGAEAVARAYDLKFPALLVTIYAKSDIKTLRPFMRKIPVLIQGHEAESEIIKKGIKQCIDEFSDQYLPERMPHRVLIRITEVHDRDINVVIPSWNHKISISIPHQQIPSSLREYIKPGERLIAYVNIGAKESEQIFIENIQAAEKPRGEYAKFLRT